MHKTHWLTTESSRNLVGVAHYSITLAYGVELCVRSLIHKLTVIAAVSISRLIQNNQFQTRFTGFCRGNWFHRPDVDPTLTLRPLLPYIDPTSTLHRPYIDPTSTLHRPYIDPTSTLHRPAKRVHGPSLTEPTVF